MKIFNDEFIYWIKRNTVCRLKGHEKTSWIDEYWAIGHGTGYQVRICRRCRKELERR